jgi:hypothetical protein
MTITDLPKNATEAVNALLANGWNYFVAKEFVRTSKELQDMFDWIASNES